MIWFHKIETRSKFCILIRNMQQKKSKDFKEIYKNVHRFFWLENQNLLSDPIIMLLFNDIVFYTSEYILLYLMYFLKNFKCNLNIYIFWDKIQFNFVLFFEFINKKLHFLNI